MIFEFEKYLTFENIYLWTNFGVLPFWLMLIFIPNSRITQILVNSIIIPLILASAYCYVAYTSFLTNNNFILENFTLYLGLDNLYTILSNENILLIFWLHFLALNIFLGSWISRNSIKYNMSRRATFAPLVFAYFTGPLGIVLYWFVRVFYAKKLGLHD